MKFRISISPFSIIAFFCFLLLFLIIILNCNADVSSQLSLLPNAKSNTPSLLSLPPKPATVLIAALDGTIYLVDSDSGRVIWSFYTGSPIYHSYQAPFNTKNNESELIECGDDWELIIHDTHFGKTRLSESVADYVAFTPTVSKDGAVILGSKRSTMFEVDARTGRLIRSYVAADYDNAASSIAVWRGDGQDVTSVVSTKNNELPNPAELNSPEFVLKMVRTDYFLQSVGPGSGIVLWTMAVAEFKAVLLCQHSENPSGSRSGFDFAMPYACKDRKLKEVYRQRKNVLLEPANIERLYGPCQGSDMLPMPTSDLMHPPQPNFDRPPPGHDGNMIVPWPMPNYFPPLQPKNSVNDKSAGKALVPWPPTQNYAPGEVLPPLQPEVSSNDSNNSTGLFPQPPVQTNASGESLPSFQPKIGFNNRNVNASNQSHMETTAPGEVDLKSVIVWSALILLIIGYLMRNHLPVVKNQVILKDQIVESDFKSSPPPKKKRARKSGKNNAIVVKQDKHMSSADEDKQTHKEAENEAWLRFDKVDGRRIGKLFVSNKEIAKGSNGTIVFEGIYEGRAVAVKRLVQAHHDVAHKEIQNLIASDRHPNIVRWYGVEYDHDFVYLALERCTCNMDDLIHIYSDISENPVFSKEQASKFFQMKTGMDDTEYLWKSNGCPSPLLLKLMRDVISGLVHLHELGIIHRDLKPQNILIIKERSLCAKLSDMGISKRLLEDMSSLGHSATGCGSSGWQAPEQLVQGRQTRAVDLFSLGCVLFFCMTAGRHPFGERLERDVNIVKNQKDLFLLEFIPEAQYLISCLLNPDPDLRPKAIEVLHHPLFWSSEMRLSFLRDVSDRVELEDRETDSDLLKALESIAPVALGTKWDEKMEPAFMTNIGRYRRYKFDSVRDLLRVMRNKLNHYRELPQEIQELIGPVPEGFNDYFASRFPRLLIEVYKFICKYCKDDECFRRYLREH